MSVDFQLLGLLKEKAWAEGNLEYQLKDAQAEMRQKILEWNSFTYVICCSRRLGKTYLLCLLAVEQCIRRRNSQVRYAAPTHKALRKFIIPVMRKVLEDCPEELRPTFKESESVYVFPNGSEIHLAGVDLHPDSLRGTACDLFLLDEGGSIKNLDYIIHDIAMPQFLDIDGSVVKGRRLVVASSPAKTPAHEFTELANEAKVRGNYSHFDIYSGGYPTDVIELFKEECGGENSSTWKREYLALDVIDEEAAIIPEWKQEYEKEPVLNQLFPFFLKYESLDIGVRDKTVCLFSHYNFTEARLYVQDEFVINGPEMTTERLAAGIKAKEPIVFQNHSVYRRISDIDLLLINDLSKLHSLPFHQTDKGHLEEMVNEVRIWAGQGRIIVSPKCSQLIGCLRYGVWNEKRSDFERSKAYGHFDALASLIYLVRNIDVRHNPIPLHWDKQPDEFFFTQKETRGNKEILKKAFNIPGGFGYGRKT